MNNIALAVASIFDKTDLSKLKALYNSIAGVKYYQDFNLFKVTKKPIEVGGKYHTVLDKTRLWLPDADDYYLKTNYFLRYEQGSWTRVHMDSYNNENQENKGERSTEQSAGITFVTMLYSSPDLKGGEALVMLPHEEPEYMTFRHRQGNANVAKRGMTVVPKIINLKQGETMVYGDRLPHGVAQVERGERIVLVTWYTRKEKQNG